MTSAARPSPKPRSPADEPPRGSPAPPLIAHPPLLPLLLLAALAMQKLPPASLASQAKPLGQAALEQS